MLTWLLRRVCFNGFIKTESIKKSFKFSVFSFHFSYQTFLHSGTKNEWFTRKTKCYFNLPTWHFRYEKPHAFQALKTFQTLKKHGKLHFTNSQDWSTSIVLLVKPLNLSSKEIYYEQLNKNDCPVMLRLFVWILRQY